MVQLLADGLVLQFLGIQLIYWWARGAGGGEVKGSKGGGAHDKEVKGEASRPLTKEAGGWEKKIENRREKRKTKLHQKMIRMEVQQKSGKSSQRHQEMDSLFHCCMALSPLCPQKDSLKPTSSPDISPINIIAILFYLGSQKQNQLD